MQIGHRDSTDGQRRAVHIDDDGNLYIYADDGQLVFGVWLALYTIDAEPPVYSF